MKKWVDVTDTFRKKDRHYKSLYLEIDEMYDDAVEVSLFSNKKGPYEIYFAFDIFYGIVYADAAKAHETRNEMKKDLEKAYRKNKQPTDDFINTFAVKYDVQIPNDMFFDFDLTSFLDNMP